MPWCSHSFFELTASGVLTHRHMPRLLPVRSLHLLSLLAFTRAFATLATRDPLIAV